MYETSISPPFGSPSTRFSAREAKATIRPSPEIAGAALKPSASSPSGPTLTRVVAPVRRSRTNTSVAALPSPPTRFDASEVNATERPSADAAAAPLAPLASAPSSPTLTRSASAVAIAGAASASAIAGISPSDASRRYVDAIVAPVWGRLLIAT